MITQTINFSFENRIDLIQTIGEAIKSICLFVIKKEEVAFEVELSVIEALTNIVQHAFLEKKTQTIELSLTLQEFEIQIKISYFSDHVKKPVAHALNFDPKDIKNLPEKGFGMVIIKELMNEVIYKSEEDKNVVLLSKKI